MAVETYWDNDDRTIIRYELTDLWTMSEFWDAFEQVRSMIESVNHRVYFILIAMDVQSMNHIPNGFITQVGSIFRKAHPRAGHVIVVRRSRGLAVQIYERIIEKTLPHTLPKFGFADSLEDARSRLAERMKAEQSV